MLAWIFGLAHPYNQSLHNELDTLGSGTRWFLLFYCDML